MENKFTPELIEKAKSAKTPEELMALAKENGVELTEESARAYLDLLHPKTGELADEELDNVSGGGCYAKDGYLMTTAGYRCGAFEEIERANAFGLMGTCIRCRHWDHDKGTGYEVIGAPLRCLNPKNLKKK